ncbi:DUF982 domain-containing protein (plasmid) [Rhizobium sp. RCAM05350]|nr:DUF982 domain-containing protein [Rhizobium sp. RCAM05350]
MHPNEIPKPTEMKWHPVMVTFLDGRVHKICGPLEAFEILNCEPTEREKSVYLNAKLCCRLALERKMSPNEARLAFIAAIMKQMLKVV